MLFEKLSTLELLKHDNLWLTLNYLKPVNIPFPLSMSSDDFYYLPEYAKSDIKHVVLVDLYKGW